MQFNSDKCKVMYFGKTNNRAKYKIAGVEIGRVTEEKDLGIYIDENFKVENQCCKAAKKENKILGMIARTFVSTNKKVMLRLYESLVRPNLEYSFRHGDCILLKT